MSNVTIAEGRELKRELEIQVMNIIKAYETHTTLRITKAEMVHFEDARFFNTHVIMQPISKRDKG